jgi:hypothetical protein
LAWLAAKPSLIAGMTASYATSEQTMVRQKGGWDQGEQ